MKNIHLRFLLITVILFSISLTHYSICKFETSLKKPDSIDELKSKLKTAKPGDVFIIPAGIYENLEIEINKSGTKKNPIILKGEGNKKTVFSGNCNHKSFFLIKGDHIILQDILFENIVFDKTIIVLDSTSYSRVTDCVFRNNISVKKDCEVIKIQGPGQHNRVDHCEFSDIKDAQLVVVKINEDFPQYTRIDNNIFKQISPVKWGNGGECVQMGSNAFAFGKNKVFTVVEFNTFIKCNGEVEIVSNKSSFNTIRNNYFESCHGELVLRGGSNCRVYGNEFKGGGGIRISGEGHMVYENTLINTSTGIKLLYGTGMDPSFYSTVTDCVIKKNKIQNPKKAGILVGDCKNRANTPKTKYGPGQNFVQNIAPYENKIYKNIISGNPENAIMIDEAPDNRVFKNVIYQD